MSAKYSYNQSLSASFQRLKLSRGLTFGVIILTALIAFEIFNYSTTEYALTDLLGNLTFLGLPWATILAFAFCGIDFAGIARLHTPEEGSNQANETWYLFGAWMLAATMNAMLTWWGISLALINHNSLGSSVIDRATMLRVVPIFVAVLVWLIRVLIIGTYSTAGTRLLTQRDFRRSNKPAGALNEQNSRPYRPSQNAPLAAKSGAVSSRTFSSQPKAFQAGENSGVRQEPVYVPTQGASQSGSNYRAGFTGPAYPPNSNGVSVTNPNNATSENSSNRMRSF